MRVVIASVAFFIAIVLLKKALHTDSSSKVKKKIGSFGTTNGNGFGSGLAREKDTFLLRRLPLFITKRFDGSFYGQRLKKTFEENIKDISWGRFRAVVIACLFLLPSASALITAEPSLLPFSAVMVSLAPFAAIRYFGERERVSRLKLMESIASEISMFLKCGVTLADTIKMCLPELETLCPRSFRILMNMLSSGKPPEEAFLAFSTNAGSEDLELIARTCLVSLQTGSEVSNVMGAIGEAVRERASLRRELEVGTLQGRLSGLIVSLLPFMFLALSIALTKDTAHVIFATPAGLLMLGLASILDIIGFLWIRKILRIGM